MYCFDNSVNSHKAKIAHYGHCKIDCKNSNDLPKKINFYTKKLLIT